MGSPTWTVCVVLFDRFELLDAVGPIELLSLAPGIDLHVVSREPGQVKSSQGVDLVAPKTMTKAPDPDLVLVPGGAGTRALVGDDDFLSSLRALSARSQVVASVCTGSALLAAAGLLDGYRATSNKKAFDWVVSVSTAVDWVPVARWVHDRDRWTSSGVAAGMDMTHALISHVHGKQVADATALHAELEIHTDPGWDPFAQHYGLDRTDD